MGNDPIGMMVAVDEHGPTHQPSAVCAKCGGDDSLIWEAGMFVCRDTHTHHRKTPIPSPDRLRKRVQDAR